MSTVKDTLKPLLESMTTIPVFYERAKKDTQYPFFVFEARRLTENDGIGQYVLEINGWDNRPTSSRIESETEKLETALHKLKAEDADRVIIIHKGQLSPVDDENKEIKRCRAQLEMQVFERRTS